MSADKKNLPMLDDSVIKNLQDRYRDQELFFKNLSKFVFVKIELIFPYINMDRELKQKSLDEKDSVFVKSKPQTIGSPVSKEDVLDLLSCCSTRIDLFPYSAHETYQENKDSVVGKFHSWEVAYECLTTHKSARGKALMFQYKDKNITFYNYLVRMSDDKIYLHGMPYSNDHAPVLHLVK